MNDEVVGRDLTDEALEELYQMALDAVLDLGGRRIEEIAPAAASAAMAALIEKISSGQRLRKNPQYEIKKMAVDWANASFELTATKLDDLHQLALNEVRYRFPNIDDIQLFEVAARTALTSMMVKIYDGTDIKQPKAYVKRAAFNWMLDHLRFMKKGDNKNGPGAPGTEPPGPNSPGVDYDEWVDPAEIAEKADEIVFMELVLRCACALLDEKDAEILRDVHSDTTMTVEQLATKHEYDPTAFTRHRYEIELAWTYAYFTLKHPRLKRRPRQQLANCIEKRVDDPDSGIAARINHAIEWADSHSTGDPKNPATPTKTLLKNTWERLRPGPGQPGTNAKARRRLLAAAAEYVILKNDAKPDHEEMGFEDDFEVVRSVRRALGMDALGSGGTVFSIGDKDYYSPGDIARWESFLTEDAKLH